MNQTPPKILTSKNHVKTKQLYDIIMYNFFVDAGNDVHEIEHESTHITSFSKDFLNLLNLRFEE